MSPLTTPTMRALVAAALDAAQAGPPLSIPAPARRCADALGADAVTISLLTVDGNTELTWYDTTDQLGVPLEDLQFTLGEGPTRDAAGTGLPVFLTDLAELPADRWPEFLPAALDLGARAIVAVPLQLGRIRIGAFTLYRAAAGPLDEVQLGDLMLLVDAATLMLIDTPARDPWHDLATLHRAEVHQATGIVSVMLDIPLAQALLRLRAYAYRHDRPILDTARDVVAHRLRLADNHREGPDRPAN